MGVTEEYLAQRKGIVEASELEWVNFLPRNEALTLRGWVAGGIKREMEVVKKTAKIRLAKGAATRVAKKIVGI